ncbi:CBS domain-containing protein [Desulfosporosinus hippei]|uniref:CBS domain-containing protein n=1 Tax=Desulfosporosinus hippei DSM 8344 TaxID=1121419 RepID=A0A1G7RM48_9FIRM|nr:CBS domain-containing protein [Desulfosporosinus hippei]SDG11763.1 CBS domain-containing protein [Desulfosporosinus hippei DSM 8344]
MTLPHQLNSLMIPMDHLLTINEYDSVRKALKLMRESFHQESAWQGPHVLVAIDNHQKPVGLLTLKTLLKSTIIKKSVQDPYFKSEYVSWHYLKKCHDQGISVREVMRPISVFSISYHNFDINTAAEIFTRNGINYIPILDNDQLIGVIDKSKIFYKLHSLSNSLPKCVTTFDSLVRNYKSLKCSISILFSSIFQFDSKKASR